MSFRNDGEKVSAENGEKVLFYAYTWRKTEGVAPDTTTVPARSLGTTERRNSPGR